MSGTNTLFNNEQTPAPAAPELSGEDSLKLLVGEGKKYATPEDLAKAMVHGQAHIVTLETEATSFKEQQVKQAGIDEILAAIKAEPTPAPQTPVLKTEEQLLADQQQAAPKEDTVSVAEQIKAAMLIQTQTTTADANVAAVTDSLTKSLGVRANEVYQQVGKSLGVNLDELSKTSPEAVIKLCTGQQTVAPQLGNLPPSNLNPLIPGAPTDVSLMNAAQIKVHAAEVKMPREDRFKIEMANALKQGDAFFKTN